MDSDNEDESTVLIVDDEPNLTATFAAWLRDEYEVREAHDVEEARERLDADVDIALLDRRIPNTSGDELLEEIRELEFDVRIAMLTAVSPDVGVVDMPFDEYAVKPVSRDELSALVESLKRRSTYDEQLQELYPLAAKRAALLEARDTEQLADSRQFGELTHRFGERRAQSDAVLNEFERDEYAVEFEIATEDDA